MSDAAIARCTMSGVFVLALAVAACLNVQAARAASPAQVDKWVGCYSVTLSKTTSHTVKLRLTPTPVPATAGAYLAESIEDADDDGMLSSWWPHSEDAINLSVGDGYVGWSVVLRSSGANLVDETSVNDDTGKRNPGWHVSVSKIPCDTQERAHES